MSVHPHLSDAPTLSSFCDGPALEHAVDLGVPDDLPVDLAALREADLQAEAGIVDGQYERVALAYREGLRLSQDAAGCWAFYADPYWKGAGVGRKPNLSRNDREDAIEFVIRRVFGGINRDRNQRASMIFRACSFLAHENVQPENLVSELKRKRGKDGRSGFKVLAELEAGRRRDLKADDAETPEADDPATVEDDQPEVEEERPSDPEQPRTEGNRAPRTVQLELPPELPQDPLPALFLIFEDGELILTSVQGQRVPVRVPAAQ